MDEYEDTFQKIYTNYQPVILRYLTRLVGEGEAEDLSQEVFVRVNRGLGSFRGEAQLSTWVYRIATNAALDRLRSSTFQRDARNKPFEDSEEPAVQESGEPGFGTVDKSLPVEIQHVRKEMNDCIREFIERLPEIYRTALVLSDLEGFQNKEVAEILGISLAAVKIRLHRAREKLKDELSTHCESYWLEGNEFAPDLKWVFTAYRQEN